uniref:Uncharacterized protein n=1 Tax=Anopheles albimanus TaxID=7167 RepID=A0A182FX86_ANOAL
PASSSPSVAQYIRAVTHTSGWPSCPSWSCEQSFQCCRNSVCILVLLSKFVREPQPWRSIARPRYCVGFVSCTPFLTLKTILAHQ